MKQDIVHVPTEGHRLPDAGEGVGAENKKVAFSVRISINVGVL